jgi:hypothetical protein
MNRAAELIKKAGNTPKLPTNEGAIAGHLRKVRALKDAGNSKADAHAQSKKMGTPPAYVDMVYNQKKEATYSDTGWQKPEVKKDQSGNVIKTKNVAKTLAKSGLRRTKDLEAAQKAKYLTFSKVKK